ncbi:hypothetical protein H5410_060152 [Solanum commersonii]|uniref:Uncharacterized protein n=1 Tax=Solanum commersonii TaxID=4109 RepID=A0A9J5W4F5_SOLCO|nr:hypothetical protein H5410_060152 [Solanum commersonii]
MEPTGPYGQNEQFSRSTIPGAALFLQKFFKYVVKTLAMELVGQNDLFSRSNEPRSRRHCCQKISLTFVKTLAMEPLALTAKTAHFQGQTSLGAEFQRYFCRNFHGPPLRPYLWNQLALTSKTIHFKGQPISREVMEPAGPDDQNSPLSRSNETRVRKPPTLSIFACYNP